VLNDKVDVPSMTPIFFPFAALGLEEHASLGKIFMTKTDNLGCKIFHKLPVDGLNPHLGCFWWMRGCLGSVE